AVPADFIGKANIVFALKYTAKSKSGTWEVKNFIVAHGTPKAPEEPEEAGIYTVSEAIEAFSNGTAGPAVVTGYIVGTIDGQVYTEGCNFSGTATAKTNLLLADNAEETDCNNCIPVQLPSGAVRDALNLVDNSGYYKKQVKLTGSLEKYFGVAGLRSVTKYEIDGVTPEEPETPDTPEGVSTIIDVLSAGAGSATVQGTIVATDARGFIVNDGTASILAYLGEDKGYNEGDVVKVSGETSVYAGLLQFGAGSKVEKVGTATVTHPTAIEMDGAAMDNYLSTPSIKYITYRGVLEINGNYYNVEIADSKTAIGSISYPKSGVVDASLNGKEIIVTGYAIGVSRSEFVNTMAVKVEAAEGGTTEPEEPEIPDTPDTPAGEEVVFDFTNPTALDPSVKPSGDVSTGIEFEEVTFSCNGISIKLEKGTATTNVRIWTKTDGTYELRTYNGSTMTISAPEGTDISSIVFNGGKIATMSPDSGTFSDGTWSGSANSVTFSVTGTLNIKTITVK
ncbi:MAG: hypothetical protein IKL29_04200, partial [Bacteroidaceae bacterium]|nr:hypothetical protein [Bacteroidaceae bacterium]